MLTRYNNLRINSKKFTYRLHPMSLDQDYCHRKMKTSIRNTENRKRITTTCCVSKPTDHHDNLINEMQMTNTKAGERKILETKILWTENSTKFFCLTMRQETTAEPRRNAEHIRCIEIRIRFEFDRTERNGVLMMMTDSVIRSFAQAQIAKSHANVNVTRRRRSTSTSMEVVKRTLDARI